FTFVGFLPYASKLVLMFLGAAAALPDEIPAEGIDLRAYYFANRKYYWGLSSLYLLQQCMLTVIDRATLSPDAFYLYEAEQLAAMAVCVSLMFVRAAWWHALWIAALIGSEYFLYGGLEIG